MKKLVSLTVLATLLAGCMDADMQGNYNGLTEEQLTTSEASLNTEAYLKAAAPKYYIGSPYKIEDVQYIPGEDLTYNQTGIAGVIPVELNGSKTSNGEILNSEQLVATSKVLPLPSIVKVTNLDNGKSVVVRVNNRGPFVNTRIMDLSSAAAKEIGITGTAKVQVQILAEESTKVKEATLGTEVEKTEPVTTTATVTDSPDNIYTVQIAAVYSEDSADALAKELSSYGNAVVEYEDSLYKVRFPNLDAAQARKLIDTIRIDKDMAPGLLKNGKWVNSDSI